MRVFLCWFMLLSGTANASYTPNSSNILLPSTGSVFFASPNGNVLKVGDNAGGSAIADGLQILGNNAAAGRVSISTLNSLSDINITPGTNKSVLIGLGAGKISAGNMTLGGVVTYSGTIAPALNFSISPSGTASSTPNYLAGFVVNSDHVDGTGLTANLLNAVAIIHNLGGSTMKGSRAAINAFVTLGSASGNTTGSGGQYIGWEFSAFGSANDNGTVGNPRGTVFGSNSVAYLNSASATNYFALAGIEVDTGAVAGSSVVDKLGIQIVNIAGDRAAGSRDDIGLSFNSQETIASGAVGWKLGIGFGRGGGSWPMSATGTMIGAVLSVNPGDTLATANGIDWSNVAFSGFSLKMPSFSVSGSGAIIGASYQVGATAGVTCSGTPTSSFASVNGIVTHC
jgi:hypothetical protein